MKVFSAILAVAAGQDVFLGRNPPGTSDDTMEMGFSVPFIDMHGHHGPTAEMVQKLEQDATTEKWTLDMWKTEEKNSFLHERGFDVQTSVYTSPPIKIKTGGSYFSIPTFTPLPFPKGDYTIIKTNFRLVNDDGSDVPLSEVYMHHWLIGDIQFPFPAKVEGVFGPCEGNLFFGAGAEMRGMDYNYPDGFGMKRIGASGRCYANIHMLRTEDLKTSWKGLNDPNGSLGAAMKNCHECGYAPGRSFMCHEPLDGTFACCFSDSRCPVNNPHDHSTKSYHLKYQVQWTRDMTKLKHMTIAFSDMRNVATLTEWNVAPFAKPSGLIPGSHALPMEGNQTCNATVCTNSNYWIVGERGGQKLNFCPGKMLWSYMHMHTGAISSTMKIDGVPHCQTTPVMGTDPNNTPGNEKGFAVKFNPCVDTENKGNAIHLKKGQRIDLDTVYDVDPQSTRSEPFPGGKHGGVMGLFFARMDCDAGKSAEEFVCRENQCVLVPSRGRYTGHNSRSRCEKECPKQSGNATVVAPINV